jgi:hypothetical protein
MEFDVYGVNDDGTPKPDRQGESVGGFGRTDFLPHSLQIVIWQSDCSRLNVAKSLGYRHPAAGRKSAVKPNGKFVDSFFDSDRG